MRFGEVVAALVPAMALARLGYIEETMEFTDEERSDQIKLLVDDPWTGVAVVTKLIEAREDGNYHEFVAIAKAAVAMQNAYSESSRTASDFGAFMEKLHREPNK
jgi:hypothetical protein